MIWYIYIYIYNPVIISYIYMIWFYDSLAQSMFTWYDHKNEIPNGNNTSATVVSRGPYPMGKTGIISLLCDYHSKCLKYLHVCIYKKQLSTKIQRFTVV